MTDDRFPLLAVYAALLVLGVVAGIWEAFLVPMRLPGGVEGAADVLAFAGNAGLGVAAARGARDLTAASMPGIGWLVAVLVAGTLALPSDEVVIPGTLGVDPGIGTVGTLFLPAGAAGALLGVLLAARFTRRANRPTLPG